MIDRLSVDALRFLKARAPASWTLPSQASMMTGLYPIEHGATGEDLSIPEGCVTIAECLAQAGYRTGAITDSGCVSPPFGFAQGFEWFEEHQGSRRDLGGTLASALHFLEQDDGRPVFLFVQTYRTHHPYRTGPDEAIDGWEEVLERHVGGLPRLHWRIEEYGVDLPKEFYVELRALYDEGVRAMDAEFGAWFAKLDRDGFFDRGYLFFASDHGEAFGLHGRLGHMGPMWEELVRVPLLLWGPELEGRDVLDPVSLVDLPRTVSQLARVQADASWHGHSLLAPRADRTILGFMGERLMAVEGPYKIFAGAKTKGLLAGDYTSAYDLAQDSDELTNLRDEDPGWAAACVRRLEPIVAGLVEQRLEMLEAQLTPQDLRDLQALGYSD